MRSRAARAVATGSAAAGTPRPMAAAPVRCRGHAAGPRRPTGATRPRRPIASAALLASCLLAAGCRDAAAPFVPPAPEAPALTRRLTASPGDDRSPSWSAEGDTVYYSAGELEGIPSAGGVLAAVSAEGGTARALLPSVQFPTSQARDLETPALAPAGDRVAFVHLSALLPPTLCEADVIQCDPPAVVVTPRLDGIVLYARPLSAGGPLTSGPSLPISVGGRDFDTSRRPEGLTGTWIVRYEPFQRAFDEDGTLPFRPSWSPDGARVVFSDGLRLLVWEPGASGAEPLPGTEDGVSAAWSPDGAWIAFARLVRGPGTARTCRYFTFDRFGNEILGCTEEKTEWPILARRLTLVRPDGTEIRELADGDEPAWTPDGTTIYYRQAGGLRRLRIDGSGGEAVPGTDGGREPAVSPDGTELAFARSDGSGGHDIWVTRLDR